MHSAQVYSLMAFFLRDVVTAIVFRVTDCLITSKLNQSHITLMTLSKETLQYSFIIIKFKRKTIKMF